MTGSPALAVDFLQLDAERLRCGHVSSSFSRECPRDFGFGQRVTNGGGKVENAHAAPKRGGERALAREYRKSHMFLALDANRTSRYGDDRAALRAVRCHTAKEESTG